MVRINHTARKNNEHFSSKLAINLIFKHSNSSLSFVLNPRICLHRKCQLFTPEVWSHNAAFRNHNEQTTARGEKKNFHSSSFVNLFYALIGSRRKLRTACSKLIMFWEQSKHFACSRAGLRIVFETKLFYDFYPPNTSFNNIIFANGSKPFLGYVSFLRWFAKFKQQKSTNRNVSSEWVCMRGRITISPA